MQNSDLPATALSAHFCALNAHCQRRGVARVARLYYQARAVNSRVGRNAVLVNRDRFPCGGITWMCVIKHVSLN
jgi:hypothetical protein